MRKLRLLAVVCILAGSALLLDVGFRLWDPGAGRTQNQLVTQLHRQWLRPARRGDAQVIKLKIGRPFAVIRIPRFGSRWRFAIVEGTSLRQLAEGPGHVRGTQLPGEAGNFAVAAHDITAGNPFLHLGSLRRGDRIIVRTGHVVYTYRVISNHVVPYTDTSVLDPVPGQPNARPSSRFITLITCTPVTLAFTPWRIVVTGIFASEHAALVRAGLDLP